MFNGFFKLPDNDSSNKEDEVYQWWISIDPGSSVESSPDWSPWDSDDERFCGDIATEDKEEDDGDDDNEEEAQALADA